MGPGANPGVAEFRSRILRNEDFLPVQAIGELRRGVEMLTIRGYLPQAALLQRCLEAVHIEYADRILTFDLECAHVWGQISGTGARIRNPFQDAGASQGARIG